MQLSPTAKRAIRAVPGSARLVRWLRVTSTDPALEPSTQPFALRIQLPARDPALARRLEAVAPGVRVADAAKAPEPGEFVYEPDSLEGCLDANAIANVALCLAHQGLDFVVVSHCFEPPPAVRARSARDAVVLSAEAAQAIRTTGRLPAGARGRVLRLLPEPAVELRSLDLDALELGPLRAEGADLVAPGRRAAATPGRRLGDPVLAPRSDRPTVLVLPTMLAVGGVERNLVEIARRLEDRFAFVVATTEPVQRARGSLNHQALRHCDAVVELGELAPQHDFIALLESLVRSLRPSVVWICNGSPWLLAHAAELRRVCAGIPIVDQQVYDTRAGWIEHYATPAIQSFDRFVAVNRQIERAFRERIGIPESRIDLVYPALDADRFGLARADALDRAGEAAPLGLPADAPLYAMVGRLTAQKRPLDFLALARDAREAGLDAHFVLVGDGELAAVCDAFIARHALDHVHRIPYCDDMSRVFPLLAGLVICSEYEGLPISMLEALAMGVPVLSTPVGDVPLVLNEYRSGQLVGPTPEPAAWLAAFRAFVAELPALRLRARAAAPRVAERFSSTAAAAAVRQSFERAIEERAAGAVRDGAARSARPMPPISVVIPTFNRGALLEETLRQCRACAGGVDLEFVVIDDGSRDDTAVRLETLAKEMPNLTWRSVPNGGPGKARNLGASLAKHDVILFLGDDIQPKDDQFFATHAELHARRPERSFAALGKVIWPNRAGGDVNFVMTHVQGRQGEQFGYADFQPYSFLDWRFFYTANVSVKRALVDDWISEGFSSAFSLAAYEDAELAYRMMQREDPMKLFYTPGSVGTHHHPFTVESFMSRQQGCGLMARVFLETHPSNEVQHMLGLGGVAHALATQPHPVGSRNVAHFLSVIEGIKSWVQLVDQHQQFGSQWWHDDLLRGVFKLCYLQGYVMGATGPRDNVSAAYYLMLEEFVQSMNRAIHVELTGRVLGGRDVEGLFSLTPLPTPVTLSPLRAWLMRRPTLLRAARSVRNRLRRA